MELAFNFKKAWSRYQRELDTFKWSIDIHVTALACWLFACYFRKCYRIMAYNRLILKDLQNEVVEIGRQIQDVTQCKFCYLAGRSNANLFCGKLIKKKINSKCDLIFNLKRIETDHCLCKAKVSLKLSSIFNLFNPLIANPTEWSNTLNS